MMDFLSVRNEREPLFLTGEVVYEAVPLAGPDQKILKRFIHRALERAFPASFERIVWPDPSAPSWANYLVIFSPGQEAGEIRCQVDVEAAGERAGFCIGYGPSADSAFSDAVERLQWFERNQPLALPMNPPLSNVS